MRYIADPELAYVIQRYRQVHDFWHTLTGLGVSVEAEIALKWLELIQTGLPVALLSSLVGPLRLTDVERKHLFDVYVPWAVQCGGRCHFLLNIMYEDHLEKDLGEVREMFGFINSPDCV